MINNSTIRTSLGVSVVGWLQSIASGIPTVDATNLATSSTSYYNDYHRLVTVDNLYNTLTDGATDNQFNTMLTALTQASTVKVINRMLTKKRPEVRAILEHETLYKYENSKENALTLTGNKFVGFEIDPTKVNNLRVTLDSVGAYFDATDSFTLYLFHSSQSTAIASQSISATEDVETWQSLTSFNLDFANDTYRGGKFYIGYRVQDITANPINREWDSSNCKTITNYMGINPISVPDYDSTTMFEPDDVENESDTYGLNFEITAKPDYTKFIVTQKSVLTQCIGYQVAYDCLEMFISSTRSNEKAKFLRAAATSEIEAVAKELTRAINDLHLDFSRLDLMPTTKKYQTYTLK